MCPSIVINGQASAHFSCLVLSGHKVRNHGDSKSWVYLSALALASLPHVQKQTQLQPSKLRIHHTWLWFQTGFWCLGQALIPFRWSVPRPGSVPSTRLTLASSVERLQLIQPSRPLIDLPNRATTPCQGSLVIDPENSHLPLPKETARLDRTQVVSSTIPTIWTRKPEGNSSKWKNRAVGFGGTGAAFYYSLVL